MATPRQIRGAFAPVLAAHGLERYWQKAPFPFERG
jgi:hypothetical protein